MIGGVRDTSRSATVVGETIPYSSRGLPSLPLRDPGFLVAEVKVDRSLL